MCDDDGPEGFETAAGGRADWLPTAVEAKSSGKVLVTIGDVVTIV